ncbi:glycosyltransferase involved in cell wall biosynthesis [Agromyces ramosus]|uniref:Glycosyltransferase involved in cell wall biosynthesis n=1 Tax=Agromyces ramosus TaxID=33879 RepID=A0A4Q7M654_9MICO|nr:glycosyltransferase [Agromyces ramosus]RZS63466.1 glycosyltransferase involved in cell wall biosynthesis [Agromyces ramosus]
MTDLVVMSLEVWDDVWRRNQHLVAGLVAGDPDLRVLFVEPPADPLHDLSERRAPSFGHAPAAVAGTARERLWTMRAVKWLPRRLDAHADERLARAVMRAAGRLGIRAPLLWINDPGAATLARLSGWPTLYDITDDWLAADRAPAELARIADNEAFLLRSAREVVVCSEELARRKGAARPVTLIPNAVDVAAYRHPMPRPSDLPGAAVALYLGTVHADRLDVPLVEATARALGSKGTLTFVGPNLLAAEETERLEQAGVRFLGARPRDDVIAYLQHADVLVVPHVVTSFTDSLDPLKLYEYQAVGRHVVSTSVAGFRHAADPRITIADGRAFAQAVAAALPAPTRFPDGADGTVADWGERVARMREVLTSVADG